jgi:hypothetical protein
MKAKEHGSGNATPRKRVRRGIEGWRTLILQQVPRAKAVDAFWAARGIPRSSFSKWRNRLQSAPTPAAQFLPVAVRLLSLQDSFHSYRRFQQLPTESPPGTGRATPPTAKGLLR